MEVAWRDGKLEKVTEATTRGLGLDLYVDGRYASVSTSDLRPEALERFVEDSVALARTLTPDPHRRLPDPALYAGQADVDLELEDPAHGALDPRRAAGSRRSSRRRPARCRARTRILSVSTGASDTRAESALVHTNGFEGTRRGTDFWISAEVTVKDPDGRRPEEYAASGARYRAAVEPPAAVGRRAAERALARLGSVKGGSAVMTMVVDARAAGRLVGALFGPLCAASLQQKRSFLEGKLGAPIGSPLLDVRDDPLVVRGLGSRLYDGEGLAARPFPVFEAGRPPQLLRRHLLRPEARDAAHHRAQLEPRLEARDALAGRSSSRSWARGSSSPASWAETPTGPPATSRSACAASGCAAARSPSRSGR